MCTELILAILYFFAIFFANFFLIKMIQKAFEDLFFNLKNETILKKFKNLSKKENFFFYIQFKKTKNFLYFLELFKKKKMEDDVIILGQIYQFLLQNKNFEKLFLLQKKNKKERNSLPSQIYFDLLKKQYLSLDNYKF
jgi:hypothetical protein